MRNPLTAMMQLADGISRSLTNSNPTSLERYRAVVEDNVEAARTILACAAHQKRVIDDVLILSRLESEMLSITPVSQRPTRVVDDVVKMFSGEVTLNGTSIKPIRDPSYDALNMDYALLDTSRLAQVLINLLSNVSIMICENTYETNLNAGHQVHSIERCAQNHSQLWCGSVSPRDQDDIR
jgi:signal transduction histidine kinase